MDNKERIYKELAYPIDKIAEQRTKGSITKKGYDTTGYGYQYLVNRFNEALGVGNWNWEFKILKEEKGTFAKGSPYYDLAGEVTIRIKVDTDWVKHTEYGGHRAGNYTDAIKGASTNGFKKCAAFFGVGKQAFEGSIDEDNRDVVGFDKDRKIANSNGTKKPVIEIIKLMEKTLTKESVETWRKTIEDKKEYNEVQKNVMLRKLEELAKKL